MIGSMSPADPTLCRPGCRPWPWSVSSPLPTVVRIERTIPAPLHRVFRAWLDPRVLERWMAPGGLEVTRAEVDERPGGRYRIFQADSGSPVGGFDCEVLELVEDDRIVFRWGFVGPDRSERPVFDSLLTVTVREASAQVTTLTLVHERLEELAAVHPGVAEKVGPGWEQALDKLSIVAGREASPRC